MANVVYDYSQSFQQGIKSIWNKWTGKGLTEAQMAENEFNAVEAEKARVFNANEAQKARDFEEQMSNTAYQRQVADLQAAGLNPALGYSANGATTPSGEAATGPAATAGSNNNGLSLGELLQSLQLPLAIAQQVADIDLTKAQTDKTGREAEKTSAETTQIGVNIEKLGAEVKNIDVDTRTKEKMYGYIDRMQEAIISVQESTAEEKYAAVRQIDKHIEKMDYEELGIMYDILTAQEQINLLIKQQSRTDAEIRQIGANIRKINKEAKLIGLNIDNFDYITVIGSESESGSFKTILGGGDHSESKPVTLADLKRKIKDILDAREKRKVDPYYDVEFDNTD